MSSTYPVKFLRRTEPIVDHYVMASINSVNGVHHKETGHYGKMTVTGFGSQQEAKDFKKALCRCALWMHRRTETHVGIAYKILKQGDGTYNLEYSAVNKEHAKAYVELKYGANKPYNPHARKIKD